LKEDILQHGIRYKNFSIVVMFPYSHLPPKYPKSVVLLASNHKNFRNWYASICVLICR